MATQQKEKKKPLHLAKMNIKKGDTVLIITGKDRGKQGTVSRAMPQDNKVIVEFASTAVPTVLLRRYDVTDFATPVKTVEVIRASGISRFVITARGPFEQSGKLSAST